MMSARLARILIALCGILGTILLGLYFGIGFSVGLAQLPPDTTVAQVVNLGKAYRNLWFMGTWLQATGSLFSVIFFLALVQRAGRVSSLAGLLTIVGSTVLLAVVLVEGVFTIALAQAALSGHPTSSLAAFDAMSMFTYVYAIVPAPVIFLSLGTILISSRLLPLAFGYVAFALGVAFVLAGFIGLFTTPLLTIIVLSLQALWVLVTAITLLLNAGAMTQATDRLNLASEA
ncbi:hypothetical protein EPA93_33900 [Ktedonosporobacter rubrisoli]|uniref:DUF4386 family protein n=1 Tax=Ktedonosporobacter rubrisoli TaxID=2509675 RepID=A0A4P6JZ14_KTERU|nr:hypothetical protein [Ktedonosporobacter rubrisoli]QBD80700.1 hypothetical protein EPA93_33900 [Ktedonosporobacter rubrisoli]